MIIQDCFYRISVKARVTDDQGRALFCYNSADKYDVLGGGLDYGESPQEGLAREILEETGLTVSSIADNPLYFNAFQTTSGLHRANVYYRTTLTSLDFVPTQECLELRYMTLEELLNEPVYDQLKIIAQKLM